MAALGIPVRQYKQVASWVGEKLARLKLNGHLLSRSPLSDLVEFEFIATAVLAKRCGFETLRVVAAADDAGWTRRCSTGSSPRPTSSTTGWPTSRREVAARVFGGDPARRRGRRLPRRRTARRVERLMCHDHDSRPPAPPRTGDVAERGILTLTSADGTEFSAAYAAPAADAAASASSCSPTSAACTPTTWPSPSGSPRPGAAAVAIDWFGRTAGVCDESGTRPRGLRLAGAHPADARRRSTPTSPRPSATCAARTRDDLPVVTVGFCFGGSHSWRQSGGDLDLAGCAGFYGQPSLVGEAADRAHLPMVMLIAGADQATPVADQLQLAETMRAAGAEVDAVVYDGAPHSFFDRAFGEWDEACQDAWRHVLALTDRAASR